MLIDSTNLVQVLDHNDGLVPVATLSGPMGDLTIQGPSGVVNIPSVLNASGGILGALTASTVVATGGNTARALADALADRINVKFYGAKGDTLGNTDGAITNGTSVFTSNATTFTSADVGKAIIVHGCGTSGAPQQGTITAFNSTHSVTVSFTAVQDSSSALFHYGTDDTTAVTNAIAAARTRRGGAVYLPPGGYWLATASAAISLQNVCLIGDGASKNFPPFTNGTGSVIFTSNSTTATFNHIAGTVVKDVTFYYPGMDGSQATPPVFPPLFEADTASASDVNNWFENIRVANAYQVFHATTSGSFARTFLKHCLIYGVNDVFYLENGFADIIQVSGCYFGPGAFGAQATTGNAYLGKWTASNGSIFNFNPGSGSYTNCDGLLVDGGIWQAYRYGIRLQSGLLDVSAINGVCVDGTGTVLDVSGAAKVLSTNFSGGEYYSINIYDATVAVPVFNINTSATGNKFSVLGVHFTFAQGSIVLDSTGHLQHLTFSGNQVLDWGRSTTVATYYVAAMALSNSSPSWTIAGNTLFGDRGGATATVSGVLTNMTGGQVVITGNNYDSVARPLLATGSGGRVVFSGNSSINSGAAVLDSTSSSALVFVKENVLDIVPSLRTPTGVATGGTVTFSSGSSNTDGEAIITGGTPSQCTISFTGTLPSAAPKSVLVQPTAVAAGTLAVIGISNTGFTVTNTGGNMGGVSFYYRVVLQ